MYCNCITLHLLIGGMLVIISCWSFRSVKVAADWSDTSARKHCPTTPLKVDTSSLTWPGNCPTQPVEKVWSHRGKLTLLLKLFYLVLQIMISQNLPCRFRIQEVPTPCVSVFPFETNCMISSLTINTLNSITKTRHAYIWLNILHRFSEKHIWESLLTKKNRLRQYNCDI